MAAPAGEEGKYHRGRSEKGVLSFLQTIDPAYVLVVDTVKSMQEMQ